MAAAAEQQPTVLLLLPFEPSPALLEQVQAAAAGYKVVYQPHGSPVADDLWRRVEVLYTFEQLPEPEQAPRLRWVQVHSAGVEAVADSALFSRGTVRLTNVSGVHAATIPEYVFTMLLAWRHHLADLFAWRQRGTWDMGVPEESLTAEELYGQTLGIVGYGSIGRQVARIGRAFGMRVLALQRNPDHRDHGYVLPGLGDPDGSLPERYFGPDQLHELLGLSDVVLLSLPSTPATERLINADALRAMRPDAVLINVGRGSVIDEPTLVQALQEHRIGAAILDVFQQEPLPDGSPLWRLPNVLLTPHMSGVSRHYGDRSIDLFVENLRRFQAGQPLLNQVDVRRGY